MQTILNPYLGFKDNAREAMEFYKTIFGGTLELNTFKDSHASSDPSEDNLIMHAALHGNNNISFMASDTPHHMEYKPGTTFSMSLTGDNKDELTQYFNKLSEGGTITQPLTLAPWGDTFGMITDKFDIQWMVSIASKSDQ